MRNGYNKELGLKIIKQREEKELTTRYDEKGNVIRDYRNEIKILSESETNNVLPEVPVIVFDGCRNFQNHIKTNNIDPVVRTVKLAPLGSPKKESFLKSIFDFSNNLLGRLIFTKSKAPIFNQNDNELKKVWAIKSVILKQVKSYTR